MFQAKSKANYFLLNRHPGQTFEYPGSCRKYFYCLEDGTSLVFDCCPGVYNPVQDACVPEEVGGELCSEDDVCE